MKRELFTRYSNELERDMNVLVFGDHGYPLIVFPTQDATSSNWEDFGMVEALKDYIEDGQIQLFCVDSVDKETWSDIQGDKESRADLQEAYHSYVCHELVPFVHDANKSELLPLAVGCDLGATQAAISALRRPDLFTGCIALSGVYRTSFFFGDWMNGTLYENDIPTFLSNMPDDHYYIDLYNHRQLVLCVGQGAWEDGVEDLRSIVSSFARLGVDAWCDFWGFDVSHDWPWWEKQMLYFLPEVLADIKRNEPSMEEQTPEAEAEAEAEAEVEAPAQEDKPEAKPAAKAEPEAEAEPKVANKPAAKAEPKAADKPAAKAEPKAKPEPQKDQDLSKLTVAQLKVLAKEAGLAASKMRKAELVAALEALR